VRDPSGSRISDPLSDAEKLTVVTPSGGRGTAGVVMPGAENVIEWRFGPSTPCGTME
jgi:hypothetical protein